MKQYFVLISLFILFTLNLNAQTTLTGIVTDSLNNPVAGASVYLSKTTIGTISDNKGDFLLNIPDDGVYEMTVSCIGYKPVSQFITADGRKQILNVKLSLNLILLDEITISSKDKNRIKNYTTFIKMFLGETDNSLSCKITNPGDIRIFSDASDNLLTAHSVKPIRIDNRALGYTIFYDLSDFRYNQETGILKFIGNYYFQPLNPGAKIGKLVIRNRLVAYYGSRMHFFRSLFSGTAFNENFKLFNYKSDPVTKEIFVSEPVSESSLINSGNNNYKTVNLRDTLAVFYTDNHPELSTSLTGYQQRRDLSTITFSDSLRIFRNGYFDNPYALTWGGAMGSERVADLLPVDFNPDEEKQNKTDILTKKSPIEEYLFSEQKSTGPDQVFLHLDRNMYKPGDTIYFQAYVKDRFTNEIGTESSSIYVVLYNPKQEKTDSSRFRIINSGVSGWMALPQTAVPGKYHLVAFTAPMQNYDPMEAFQLDIYVRPLNNNPGNITVTFDKENYRAGDTITAFVKILRPDNTLADRQKFRTYLLSANSSILSKQTSTDREGLAVIRFHVPDTLTLQPGLQIVISEDADGRSSVKEVKVPFNDQYFELRFLPEGGNLIAGLRHRTGFNATNYKGEPVYIEALLKDSTGSVMDTIRSGKYGPGSFLCTPQHGLYAELINIPVKQKIWPLPEPLISGVSLSIKPFNNSSFAIEIQSDKYNGELLTVAGTMNSVQVFSQEVTMDKRQRLIIESEMIPAGVVQVTVFNKELKPLAERLYYVNANKHLKFSIRTTEKNITPGQETELEISVTDGQGNPARGVFSISVSDSLSGHNAEIFTPDIDFTFNYHPYFLSNLPSEVLIKGIENLTDEERDILVMVYGWRKYDWNLIGVKKIETKPLGYDQIDMKILYALKWHRADRQLDLVSLEGPSIKHLLTDNKGIISLPIDSLPEITRSVTMLPNSEHNKKIMGAMLSIPFNEKYFSSNKLHAPQPLIQYDTYKISATSSGILPGEDVIEIPEVTIKAHPVKREYHDQYEEEYQYADVRSLDYELLWSAFSVKDALYRMFSPFMMTDNYVILRPPRSMVTAPVPALVVLDGMALPYRGWDQVRSLPADELTSLTVLIGKQGYARYGEMAQGGIIFVNTRSSNPSLMQHKTDWILQNKKDHLLVPIYIFRPTREFYSPSRHEMDLDPVLQSRSTTYWAPEIYFDGKEPVKIKYTNLKRRGPVIIRVNGVSTDNLVGTGRAAYTVF